MRKVVCVDHHSGQYKITSFAVQYSDLTPSVRTKRHERR